MTELRKESEKARGIECERYVLVISKALTIRQKEKILLLFPNIASLSDVVSGQDLNDWLRDFPAVEQTHYKLWLPSLAVIEGLLRGGRNVWQEETRSHIEETGRLYVQTPAFHDALNVLNAHRIVVITGGAGIGKTTLALALLGVHMRDGYAVHEIEAIGSHDAPIPPEGNVILYVDDFLGRSVWKDNADSATEARLRKLFSLVERNSRLRLVLTTRQYLLEDAGRLSDSCHDHLRDRERVVLRLESYSRTARALILYNHLFFKGVDRAYCANLADWQTLDKILSHRNYTPRLVESVCQSRDWPTSLSPNGYGKFVLEVLDHPAKLYRQVIAERIGDLPRDILFCLATFRSRSVSLPDLQARLSCLYEDLGLPTASNRSYESALKVLDGSLITIGVWSGQRTTSFMNPGIEEAARSELWRHDDRWEALVAGAETGETLVSLAVAYPGTTAAPFARGVELPGVWYESWLRLAASEGNHSEIVYNLGRAYDLNVWKGKDETFLRVVQAIWKVVEETGYSDVEWMDLAGEHRERSWMGYHSELEWLESELTGEAEQALAGRNPDADEIVTDFERLGRMGALGTAGSMLLESAAKSWVETILSENALAEEPDGSDLNKAETLNEGFGLDFNERIERMRRRVKTDSSQDRRVESNPNRPQTTDDRFILRLFESLS